MHTPAENSGPNPPGEGSATNEVLLVSLTLKADLHATSFSTLNHTPKPPTLSLNLSKVSVQDQSLHLKLTSGGLPKPHPMAASMRHHAMPTRRHGL